jgi:flagellar hook-associated protein 2
VGSGALSGSYSLDVVSLGSQENTISADGLTTVTDPTGQNFDGASSYSLTVEGQSYTITPTGSSLDSLVQAINDSAANVQATVVNVGSASSPDYRLSIQSNDYAPAGIELSDGTNTSLLQTVTGGAYVQYQVNGEPLTPVSATSRDVTISPGLTVSLTGTGTTTISVSASTSAVSNALQNFVSAYNTVAAELEKNRGQNGGALAGQSVVYELQNQLSGLINSTSGSGNVTSLANLGLSFDTNGNLQFDSSALTAANPQDVLNFLGTTTSGGFLENATNVLSGITDPTTGLLTTDTTNISNQLTQIGTQISNDEANVSNLQTTLTQQMATADAAISSLEQQVNEMTDLFASMQQDSKNVTG